MRLFAVVSISFFLNFFFKGKNTKIIVKSICDINDLRGMSTLLSLACVYNSITDWK